MAYEMQPYSKFQILSVTRKKCPIFKDAVFTWTNTTTAAAV